MIRKGIAPWSLVSDALDENAMRLEDEVPNGYVKQTVFQIFGCNVQQSSRVSIKSLPFNSIRNNYGTVMTFVLVVMCSTKPGRKSIWFPVLINSWNAVIC